MPVTKYGKYISREIIEASKYPKVTAPIVKFRGNRGGKDLTFEYSCITSPLIMDDEPEVNEFDQFMYFGSGNIEDLAEFQAEIELPLGKEGKKQIINQPRLVYIPQGLAHGPVKFKSIKKPIVFMNIALSSKYSSQWNEPDYSKYVAKPDTGPFVPQKPGDPPTVQSIHPRGTPFRYLRNPHMAHVEFWGKPIGWPAQLCFSLMGPKYREYAYLEAWHYHTQAPQYSFFIGGNPLNFEEFDAEIELFLGKEHEKHVIDTCAAICIPEMVIHAGDEVRRIGKPYARIMTKVGSNDMYDDPRGGKVLTSKEEWGEPMIPEGARDYVLLVKADPKNPGI